MPKRSKKHKKPIPHKKILAITIIVGVLVLAVLVGVLARFLQQKTDNQRDEIFVPGQGLPRAVNDSQSLSLQGKNDEANKKLEDALQKNPQDAAKYELYIQQGINYQNQKDYSKALDSYRKAEAIKQDDKITLLIAEVAMLLNDKPLALEYYRKTVTLLPTDNPLYESEKQRIEAKIKVAGG